MASSSNRRSAPKREGYGRSRKPMQRNQSTGPKTTRRDAMRHGLTAATVVTAIEDAQEFVLAVR